MTYVFFAFQTDWIAPNSEYFPNFPVCLLQKESWLIAISYKYTGLCFYFTLVLLHQPDAFMAFMNVAWDPFPKKYPTKSFLVDDSWVGRSNYLEDGPHSFSVVRITPTPH